MGGRLRGLAMSVAILLAATAGGADLVEPWDPGFTDLELWQSRSEGGEGETAVVLGFGLGEGISLGASLTRCSDGSARFGGIAMLTVEPAPGAALDLWMEAGVQRLEHEAELGRTDWAVGAELSRELRGVVPYLRLTSSAEGGDATLHPLVGLMVPLSGGVVELHLELSSEEPEAGPWPAHLAIGPNVHLTDWLELLPELSVIRDRAAGVTSWGASVGVIVDPLRWFRG